MRVRNIQLGFYPCNGILNNYKLTKTKRFSSLFPHYLVQYPQASPALEEIREKEEGPKGGAVRIALPSCPHIATCERLSTNNTNHHQFADSRATRRQPLLALYGGQCNPQPSSTL